MRARVDKEMATNHNDPRDDIREGLLCPICMEDLGTINQLQSHFEEAHNTEEDKDVLQSFKGWSLLILLCRHLC